MKNFLLIILLSFSINLYSQGSIGSIGLGGGPSVGYLNPSLSEINKTLSSANFKEFGGGFFGYGGGLVATISDFRVGYLSLGGKKETSNIYNNNNHVAMIDFGYNMGIVGYEFFTFDDFHLSVDLGLGAGTIDLQTIQTSAGVQINWDNIWGTNYKITSRNLSTTFFQYQPSLVVEYIYGGFLKIFVAGDYIGSFEGNWKLNQKYDISGMPKMNFNGFSVRTGIYVGIFF